MSARDFTTRKDTAMPQDTSPRSADDLLMSAWGVIANVSGGNWNEQSDDWQGAALRWREQFRDHLDSDIIAPELTETLRDLFDKYGPAGVAKAVDLLRAGPS